MYAFVWDVSAGLTDGYHSGGSALVVADTTDEARDALRNAAYITTSDYPPNEGDAERFAESLAAEPRLVLTLEDGEGTEPVTVLIFGDRGCC